MIEVKAVEGAPLAKRAGLRRNLAEAAGHLERCSITIVSWPWSSAFQQNDIRTVFPPRYSLRDTSLFRQAINDELLIGFARRKAIIRMSDA